MDADEHDTRATSSNDLSQEDHAAQSYWDVFGLPNPPLFDLHSPMPVADTAWEGDSASNSVQFNSPFPLSMQSPHNDGNSLSSTCNEEASPSAEPPHIMTIAHTKTRAGDTNLINTTQGVTFASPNRNRPAFSTTFRELRPVITPLVAHLETSAEERVENQPKPKRKRRPKGQPPLPYVKSRDTIIKNRERAMNDRISSKRDADARRARLAFLKVQRESLFTDVETEEAESRNLESQIEQHIHQSPDMLSLMETQISDSHIDGMEQEIGNTADPAPEVDLSSVRDTIEDCRLILKIINEQLPDSKSIAGESNRLCARRHRAQDKLDEANLTLETELTERRCGELTSKLTSLKAANERRRRVLELYKAKDGFVGM